MRKRQQNILLTKKKYNIKLRAMSRKNYRTDILFPRTNALIGMGSVFNLAGNYFDFNRSISGEEADKLAILNDWGVIGDDLRFIIRKNPKKKFQKNNQ